ncbi:hypothetical protein RYX36_015939, partial [Vicia faba]
MLVWKRLYRDYYAWHHDLKWDVKFPMFSRLLFNAGIMVGHWLESFEGLELSLIPGGWSNLEYAKVAAIVMRTVRNTMDTGCAVVCMIHQPSIDIFDAFDELLLMKLRGEQIYVDPFGRNSAHLIQYFEFMWTNVSHILTLFLSDECDTNVE